MNELILNLRYEWMILMIFLVLLIRKIFENGKDSTGDLILVSILLAATIGAGLFFSGTGDSFGSMFRSSRLIDIQKAFLAFGTLLVVLQSHDRLKNHKHSTEFYLLLLSTLLGMFFMISSRHFLMFFIGLELATIPIAALVAFDTDRIKSAEAGMKLILLAAFSSAGLLLGLSFLYGATGSMYFSEIAERIDGSPLHLLALTLVFAGFAFKISAVPFHLWTADVFEGAPVNITAYLSVVSKGAVIFILTTVLQEVFVNASSSWVTLVTVASVLSMTMGNLFAIRQNNIKRFLAFSSISQVGYILIGLAVSSASGNAAVLYFIPIYIVSNLGAFSVISAVSAATGKEEISDYKGFYKTNPALSWVLLLSLFSLAGIPPAAGFFGKFFLLIAGASKGMVVLVVVAVVNIVIALYYYLLVVKAMFIDKSDQPIEKIKISFTSGIAMIICIAGILAMGLIGNVYEYIFELCK